MKSSKNKEYERKRMELMEQNYQKSTNKAYKEINNVYSEVLKEVEEKLEEWRHKKRPPTFGWSERKQLEETKKAIELILDELAEIEYHALSQAMDDIFLKDLMDLNKLEIEYLAYRDDLEIQYMIDYALINPNIEANAFLSTFSKGIPTKTDAIEMVEYMLRQPIDTSLLSQNIWYKGCQGKGYVERIVTRQVDLHREINNAIQSMYAQGKGYDYAVDRVKQLVEHSMVKSNYYARRLVSNECRIAENSATVTHYTERMGVKYFKRSTTGDSHVCKICKAHAKDVYTAEELKNNPFKAILHVGDRCALIPLSSKRGEEEYRKYLASK